MKNAPLWERLLCGAAGYFGIIFIVALLAAAAGLGPLPALFK